MGIAKKGGIGNIYQDGRFGHILLYYVLYSTTTYIH